MSDNIAQYPLLYSGSVKNVRAHPGHPEEAVFEFTDDYSVFDWGKMPDAIPGKGEALLEMAIHFFKRIGDSQAWGAYFGSDAGRKLMQEFMERADVRPVAVEVASQLLKEGMRTHFRGVVGADSGRPQGLRVENVAVRPPHSRTIYGQGVPDYGGFPRNSPGALIPLEVVFRFEITPASSILKRMPQYKAGQRYDFPILETFTKLEDTDRPLSFSESLYVGRIDAETLERMLVRTAFAGSFLRWEFGEHGLELLDGKLEWALDRRGNLMLVDAIGPDELRIRAEGASLSKEKLREFYRATDWYAECQLRQKEAGESADWQSLVKTAPPPLPAEIVRGVSEMYRAIALRFSGREARG